MTLTSASFLPRLHKSGFKVGVLVAFNLVPKFLEATERMFGFMLKGLKETEADLRKEQIPFHLLMGSPVDTIPKFARKVDAIAIVCDMSPLGYW